MFGRGWRYLACSDSCNIFWGRFVTSRKATRVSQAGTWHTLLTICLFFIILQRKIVQIYIFNIYICLYYWSRVLLFFFSPDTRYSLTSRVMNKLHADLLSDTTGRWSYASRYLCLLFISSNTSKRTPWPDPQPPNQNTDTGSRCAPGKKKKKKKSSILLF